MWCSGVGHTFGRGGRARAWRPMGAESVKALKAVFFRRGDEVGTTLERLKWGWRGLP
ncbi:hypothetical protein Csa_003392 [Cucumis sativus]|uniref:Uncharacterized protein n=1 Tax=Cucumis sativus TaxID=3659 RepID=A0A0A0KNE0_CUCSA|nr:hypothetical protein Csa_003392 [Cucumis sativus]